MMLLGRICFFFSNNSLILWARCSKGGKCCQDTDCVMPSGVLSYACSCNVLSHVKCMCKV